MSRILVLLLTVLPGLAQAQPSRPDTTATRVQVRGADCALFPAAARLPDWLPQSHQQPARFTPGTRQVAQVEQALRRQHLLPTAPGPGQGKAEDLRDAKAAREIVAALSTYRRQYFGFYNQQRQCCLVLNCLKASMLEAPASLPAKLKATLNQDWLHRPIYLADGGRGHWSVCYNLTTGQFYNFWYNLDVGGG